MTWLFLIALNDDIDNADLVEWFIHRVVYGSPKHVEPDTFSVTYQATNHT